MTVEHDGNGAQETGVGGDCYASCLEVLIEFEAVAHCLLVHGFPVLTTQDRYGGRPYGHAWLELGGVLVWDHRGGLLPKTEYYQLGKIDESLVTRYTRHEAMAQACKHETYGPWDYSKAPEATLFCDEHGNVVDKYDNPVND